MTDDEKEIKLLIEPLRELSRTLYDIAYLHQDIKPILLKLTAELSEAAFKLERYTIFGKE